MSSDVFAFPRLCICVITFYALPFYAISDTSKSDRFLYIRSVGFLPSSIVLDENNLQAPE